MDAEDSRNKNPFDDILENADKLSNAKSLFELRENLRTGDLKEEQERQAQKLREKVLAWLTRGISRVFIFMAWIIMLQGVNNVFYGRPFLSDAVIITLLTCSAISSIASLLGIVLKYLFPDKQP